MSQVRTLGLALLLGALVLSTVGYSSAAPDKFELKVAQKVMAKLISGGTVKDVAKQKKETSVEAIMALLGNPKAGGTGYGPKGTTSIEKRLQELAKNGIDAADLASESAELTKAVQLTHAVNDFNDLYTPTSRVAGKDPKVWSKSNADAKKAATDLLAAIKSKDAKKVQTSAQAMDVACTACHNVFK